MRHLELLIEQSRMDTGNERYSSDSGISQRAYAQKFQNAQDIFVRQAILSKSKYFSKSATRSVVSGQQEYTWPSDCFMNSIDTIQYSTDARSWSDALTRCIAKDQGTTTAGYPFGYIPQKAGYLLTPPISTGYLLETYSLRPKRLEKRSGKITAITGSPITSLTIDTAFDQHDPTYLNKFQTITIVGADGIPKVASMPISSVSAGTVTVTNYTLASGEAVAVGDYVLAEGNTTNVPGYDDTVESFLILHANYQIRYGDASAWTKEVKEDVSMHLKQIVSVLGTLSEDVIQIPIINTDFLSMG